MDRLNTTTEDFFDSLTLSEKYGYITNLGKYIGERSNYEYIILLHLLDDSFYEVWYHKRKGMIEKIEYLDDLNTLDLYINHMVNLEKK